MAASVTIWEAANLFAGDDGPNNSKHLTLSKVKLPDMTEKTEEHHGGGAIGAINIAGLGLNALEMSFDLVGADPQTMVQFGISSKATRPYTIYAVHRDKLNGRAIERKAVVFGRLTELTEDEYSRGQMGSQSHKITEIMHYELYIDRQEIYFYDYPSNTWRVRGVDQYAETNSILRIG